VKEEKTKNLMGVKTFSSRNLPESETSRFVFTGNQSVSMAHTIRPICVRRAIRRRSLSKKARCLHNIVYLSNLRSAARDDSFTIDCFVLSGLPRFSGLTGVKSRIFEKIDARSDGGDQEINPSSSAAIKDKTNIKPHVFVQGIPENEASLIAAGSVLMIKNSHRGHV